MSGAVHVLKTPEDVKNQEHKIYKGREKNSHKKKNREETKLSYTCTLQMSKMVKSNGSGPSQHKLTTTRNDNMKTEGGGTDHSSTLSLKMTSHDNLTM